MKDFNLRHLRIFETIASCGSFSRAAEQLGMSQPAVSMQLRQLETDLGTLLFERPPRQRLTDAGQDLLQHARVILAQVRATGDAMAVHEAEANGASAAGARGTRGLLHLGVVSTAHYFAPRLLSEFHRRHPEVRLKLTVAKRSEVLAMLQEHRLDIAITGYPPSEADLEAASFARHPHCIVAHPGHALAQRRGLVWADLRDEEFIFREPGSATRPFFGVIPQIVDAEGKVLEDPAEEVPDYVFSRTLSPEDAPDRATYITVDFERGDAVAVDGNQLSPAKLLAALNELGKANGIGRLDLVENRFVGMKSRGVYEAPGMTALYAAHLALEQLTLDRETVHLRDRIAPEVAEYLADAR